MPGAKMRGLTLPVLNVQRSTFNVQPLGSSKVLDGEIPGIDGTQTGGGSCWGFVSFRLHKSPQFRNPTFPFHDEQAFGRSGPNAIPCENTRPPSRGIRPPQWPITVTRPFPVACG